jgi:hypothetical protein
MIFLRSDRLRLSLILLGACASSVGVSASAATAAGTFNHGVFSPTSGRVGYHMPPNFGFYDWDEPTGDNSACHPGVAGMTAAGTLPPGLALVTNDVTGHAVHGFEGTPRQPGDWNVTVTIQHVACMQGPDQTDYGPRTVEVHFHIDP